MWKDIIGWEELYQVNENGEVRNKKTLKLIIGDINSAGYYRVRLYSGNRKERFFRHRLVAIHFIPNPDNLPEVNHIDEDKSNNSVVNIEWISRKDNELHSRRKGCTSKEYKPYKVIFNDGEEVIYEVKQELADRLDVTRATVKNYLHGKSMGYIKFDIKEIKYLDDKI